MHDDAVPKNGDSIVVHAKHVKHYISCYKDLIKIQNYVVRPPGGVLNSHKILLQLVPIWKKNIAPISLKTSKMSKKMVFNKVKKMSVRRTLQNRFFLHF